MFSKTQTSVNKTQRKDQCGIRKTLNIKTMFHIKNKKQPKSKKVIFLIECLEVSLKGNRDEKYTSLCRKT